MAQVEQIVPGAQVEWTTWDGSTARATVLAVTVHGVTLVSSDGHGEIHPTGPTMTLADLAARWTIAESPEHAH